MTIRNITGASDDYQRGNYKNASGALYRKDQFDGKFGGSSNAETNSQVGLDASRVVPTANKNQVNNIALLGCIYYL